MNFLDDSKKKINRLSEKEIAEKYSVIISFSDGNILDVDFVSNKNDPSSSRFFIRDELGFFSESQKKVLKKVREIDGWEEKIDIKIFFKQLKKSGFKIYFTKNNKTKQINFTDNIVSKIKVDIFLANNDVFFPICKDDFIFKITENNLDKKDFLFVDDGLFYVKDNNIFFLKTGKIVKNIFERALEKEFHKTRNLYSEKKQTKLMEKEVIEINKIIKKTKEIFDTKTCLEDNFLIEEHRKLNKYFLVNFDLEKSFLEIRAIVDYGVKKIDVADTVSLKNFKGEKKFIRSFHNFLDSNYIFNISDKKISYAKVSQNDEINFFKDVLSFHQELGFSKKIKLEKKNSKQINLFIQNNWENFSKIDYKVIYEKDKIDKKSLHFNASVNVQFSNDKNLLDFDAEFYLGKDRVTLGQLQGYSAGKTKYILGKNGEMIDVKNKKELDRFISMINSFHQNEESGKFEGKIFQATELENIFTSSEYYNAKFNSGFDKFISEAKSGKPIEEIKIPNKYSEILRDYQKDGIDWLYFLKKYHFGGILADDMGLGKTIQTLIMLELNKKKGKPSIVIVPKTLIGNWQEESEKFTEKMKILVVDGSKKDRIYSIKKSKEIDLIITSYACFQNDSDFYKQEGVKFNYAVLDEAQYIKNFKTKNAQIVKEIDADFRLALTGTPLENSISEIWSIFEFLMPGFLGKYSEFSRKFIIPISKNGDEKKMDDLRKKISIFMLRRTKKSVLKELPKKTVQNLYVPLSNDQSILYQEILAKTKKELISGMDEKNFGKSYLNILAALTKLRQVCNHPNLILKEDDYKKYNSAKLDVFLNLVQEIRLENRKVLVFSQFKTMLKIFKQELDERKIKYSYLAGETKNRKELIDDFNSDSENSVFLISLKAGGVGINLTSADNVIIFDPWWNPSVERQAIDRVHRIGQEKKVNVYKIITKGTVEEKILALQEKKQNIFDNLIDDNGEVFKKLSWDDIRDLF